MASDAYPEQLEQYLQAVAGHLTSWSHEDRLEVIRELRSHVLDTVNGDFSQDTLTSALAKLGIPRMVAQINLRMRVASAEVNNRTPWNAAKTVARLAFLGSEGLWVFVLSSIGYAFAGCWLLTALAKPFAPDRVGLWLIPDAQGDLSLSLGRHGAGALGHDILGWWIIPLGLVIAGACGVAMYRYDLRFVRRMANSSVWTLGLRSHHDW
ncbi:MAG: HAAS signaling domain-containing protein [Steroidobacteraceae bacterium]